MIFLGKIGSKEGKFKDMASQAKKSTKFTHTTKYLSAN